MFVQMKKVISVVEVNLMCLQDFNANLGNVKAPGSMVSAFNVS